MALRKYKPITAGTRWRIGNAYAEVTTNIPEKSLLEKERTGGRNSRVEDQCATEVVVIRRYTVSLISKGIRKIFLQLLHLLNTIQTVLHLSHC